MRPEAEAAAGALHLQHHFPDLAKQTHAARLGMWLFLASEILLFTGLFAGYAVYRFLYADAFREASRHGNLLIGTINTFVLITSSLTVALSIHFAKQAKGRTAALLILVTLLLGLTFMGLKAIEYAEHFHEGALPGPYYRMESVKLPGVSMYFTLYFIMTGLHGVHVLAGMGALAVVMVRAARGAYSGAYHTPVELAGLYWHLVDLIWIFLYPLLYLI